MEVTAQSPPPIEETAKPSKTHIYFVDILRGALVALVILHHTAISYGGSGYL